MNFYVVSKKGIIVNLHILPNSQKTYIYGRHGNSIKIKLKAPPVDGKANKELIKYIDGILKEHNVKSEITGGRTSRSKTILLKNFFDTKFVEKIFKGTVKN